MGLIGKFFGLVFGYTDEGDGCYGGAVQNGRPAGSGRQVAQCTSSRPCTTGRQQTDARRAVGRAAETQIQHTEEVPWYSTPEVEQYVAHTTQKERWDRAKEVEVMNIVEKSMREKVPVEKKGFWRV